VLHEHAASLSAASHANRSRRLIKCAKDSGHYRKVIGGKASWLLADLNGFCETRGAQNR
jgi:hypothetical protein